MPPAPSWPPGPPARGRSPVTRMSVGTDAGARADRRQHGAQAGHGDGGGGGGGGLSAEDRRPARGAPGHLRRGPAPLRRDRQHVYAQQRRRPGQAHGRGPPRRGTTPPQGGERAGGARDLGGEFTGERGGLHAPGQPGEQPAAGLRLQGQERARRGRAGVCRELPGAGEAGSGVRGFVTAAAAVRPTGGRWRGPVPPSAGRGGWSAGSGGTRPQTRTTTFPRVWPRSAYACAAAVSSRGYVRSTRGV